MADPREYEYGGFRGSVSAWARRLGMPFKTLDDRIKRYGFEAAVTKPYRAKPRLSSHEYRRVKFTEKPENICLGCKVPGWCNDAHPLCRYPREPDRDGRRGKPIVFDCMRQESCGFAEREDWW